MILKICFRVCGIKLHWAIIAVIWTLAFGKSGILNTSLNFVNIEIGFEYWRIQFDLKINVDCKDQNTIRSYIFTSSKAIFNSRHGTLNFCHKRIPRC